MSVGNAVSAIAAVEVGNALGAVDDEIGVAVGTVNELVAGVAQALSTRAAMSANRGSLIDRTTPSVAAVFCRLRLALESVARTWPSGCAQRKESS